MKHTQKTMGRPKIVHDGVKLNLFVPRTVKQLAYQLATEEDRSVSMIFTDLIRERANLRLTKSPVAAEAPSALVPPPPLT
jgi:hypothetical protein